MPRITRACERHHLISGYGAGFSICQTCGYFVDNPPPELPSGSRAVATVEKSQRVRPARSVFLAKCAKCGKPAPLYYIRSETGVRWLCAKCEEERID